MVKTVGKRGNSLEKQGDKPSKKAKLDDEDDLSGDVTGGLLQELNPGGVIPEDVEEVSDDKGNSENKTLLGGDNISAFLGSINIAPDKITIIKHLFSSNGLDNMDEFFSLSSNDIDMMVPKDLPKRIGILGCLKNIMKSQIVPEISDSKAIKSTSIADMSNSLNIKQPRTTVSSLVSKVENHMTKLTHIAIFTFHTILYKITDFVHTNKWFTTFITFTFRFGHESIGIGNI